MHQVRPGMVIRHGRMPHVTLFVLTVLGALWALGSLVALVFEFSGGALGPFDYHGWQLPAWPLFAVSIPIASYVTRDSYTGWRMTGSNHGMIDYVLEPAGIWLVRQRNWARAHELLVQRGETVQIDAVLIYRRRAGLERLYRFTVSAPAGSFSFSQDIHIERLSVVPLDEVARQMGVQVELSGAALAIERLGADV
jgi:hypothetical protein